MANFSLLKRIEGAHDAGIWATDWCNKEGDYFTEIGRIITGSLDSTVKIWDYQPQLDPPNDLTCYKTVCGPSLAIVSCSVSLNATLFATSSLDSNISIWDLETGEKKQSIDCGPLESWAVRFTSDSRHVISGSGDGNIQLYNVETGKKEKTFETKNTKMALCLATSPDSQWMACGRENGLVSLLDENGNFAKTFEGHAKAVRAITFTQELPDSRFLITGSDDKLIKIYSLRGGFHLVGTLSGHKSQVLGLSACTHGCRLASCSADKSVRIWDYYEMTCLYSFSNAHTDKIWSVVWIAKNKLLSVSEDKAMNLYFVKY